MSELKNAPEGYQYYPSYLELQLTSIRKVSSISGFIIFEGVAKLAKDTLSLWRERNEVQSNENAGCFKFLILALEKDTIEQQVQIIKNSFQLASSLLGISWNLNGIGSANICAYDGEISIELGFTEPEISSLSSMIGGGSIESITVYVSTHLLLSRSDGHGNDCAHDYFIDRGRTKTPSIVRSLNIYSAIKRLNPEESLASYNFNEFKSTIEHENSLSRKLEAETIGLNNSHNELWKINIGKTIDSIRWSQYLLNALIFSACFITLTIYLVH